MRYSKDAMDALRTARENNSNVSQRRLAFNIFMLTGLDKVNSHGYAGMVESTRELYILLGRPSEVALQHLIRGIDRQIRENVTGMAWARDRATPSRKSRSSRNRKTAGVGSVHRI